MKYLYPDIGFDSFSHRFGMSPKMLWTLYRSLLISGHKTLTGAQNTSRTCPEHPIYVQHMPCVQGYSIFEALQNEVKIVWTQFSWLILRLGARVKEKFCRAYLLFAKAYQLLPILWKNRSLLSLHLKLTANIVCSKTIWLVMEHTHCHNIFLTSLHLKDHHFLLINNLSHNTLSFQFPSMSFAFW